MNEKDREVFNFLNRVYYLLDKIERKLMVLKRLTQNRLNLQIGHDRIMKLE